MSTYKNIYLMMVIYLFPHTRYIVKWDQIYIFYYRFYILIGQLLTNDKRQFLFLIPIISVYFSIHWIDHLSTKQHSNEISDP